MAVKIRERKWTYHSLMFVLLLLFPISMAVTTFAGPFEDAVAAHERGDYATAYRLFHPLAEQNDAQAQFTLGLMYSKGQGVPQDNAEAMKWVRKAAGQGLAEAQFYLGMRYSEGRGVPQDYAEAVKWYRRAAEQGHAKTQFNLGLMYSKDQGVPQDYVLAHMWFNLAASRASASEGKLREDAVKNRDIVASWMTPYQIAEAQRLAREWKPKKEVR